MTELHELERNGLAEGQLREAASAAPVGASESPPPAVESPAAVAGQTPDARPDPDVVQSPNRFAEAGRMGAQRVHELIREGKLYEREHGLKPGRQRLRQLIQQGKLYEREHGLNGVGAAQSARPVRMSSERAMQALLESLLRVAKPAFRKRLLRVLQSLEGPEAAQN